MVRSLRASPNADDSNSSTDGEETSTADVQGHVAETVNDSPTASIPIPTSAGLDSANGESDSDVERGLHDDRETPTPAPTSAWQNIISGSLSALSGETLRQGSPRERDRTR